MRIPFFHRIEEGQRRRFGINYLRNKLFGYVQVEIHFPLPLIDPYDYYTIESDVEYDGLRLLWVNCQFRCNWRPLGPQKVIETSEQREDRLYLERKTVHD